MAANHEGDVIGGYNTRPYGRKPEPVIILKAKGLNQEFLDLLLELGMEHEDGAYDIEVHCAARRDDFDPEEVFAAHDRTMRMALQPNAMKMAEDELRVAKAIRQYWGRR